MLKKTLLRRQHIPANPERSPQGRRVAITGTRGYPSYYGGFETLVRRLVPYLLDRGWQVTVYGRERVAHEDPSRDERAELIETAGLDWKSLSTLSFGMTSAIDAAVDRSDVALVMNVANGFWLPLLDRRQVPTVVNVDGIEWERAKWGPVAQRVFRAGARVTANHATTLVYDAQAIRQRWMDRYGRDGIVIPYGGEVHSALPVPLGLTSRAYVLLVARFVPENTVREFFDAVPKLAEVAPVVIVGSGGYGGELDARAEELARIRGVQWLGHVSDDRLLFSLWEHCGAYFHGHSVGGTNPALVQAMACGAPVVARDTVYNREVLGEVGVFTQPSAEAIADEVLSLLASPGRQDRLARLARERAQARYNWDDVCSAYESALADAVDRRRGSEP
ncbi:glycosyltransferase [Ornithinimicrobium pratense]|uniref:Glycosyltransferase family 1 protein n=1 Tax=Ornithinimicrobium pratense TaxID=2593973 RepID=A0A5J6V9L4_9MICO|nr:glycosyltransferase [Ornithinimicrobium pratense]QFG69722.1 glycosyltransferase family 1 protein [Ornithinimicrobium pratense]